MHTIVGSSRRDCVLQLSYFNFMALKLGSLKVIYSGWVSMIPPPIFILKEELIQYKSNLIKLLSNLSEMIPGQKADDIVDADVISFLY